MRAWSVAAVAVCVLSISLSWGADAPGQTPADMARWRTVTAWEGTFTAVYRVHSTIGTTIESNTLKTATGHVILDKVEGVETLPGEKPPTWAGATVWKGKVHGHMSSQSRSITMGPGGKLVAESLVDGGGSDDEGAELAIQATKGTYDGHVDGLYCGEVIGSKTVYAPGGPYSSTFKDHPTIDLTSNINGKLTQDELSYWQTNWDLPIPPRPTADKPFAGLLPNKGLRLTGSYRGHGVLDVPPMRADSWLSVSWTFWPLEEIEVVVDIDGYDDWLPRGNFKDLSQPGNSLKIKATLQTKDGKPTTRKAEEFVFELASVSQEPGVCMNAPLYSPVAPIAEADDLYWQPGTGIAPEQRREGVTGGGNTATAKLYCRDFGAYGILRVTAIMEGSSGEIPGHLRGDPARTDIRIPKTEDNSIIATAWKKANKVTGYDDKADDEPLAGYLHPGDGLSMYEEYRGFVVRGKHKRTDPLLKTFFVHPSVPHADGALRLLKAASGIQVLRIDPDEYHGDHNRQVNFNHGACHVVDQHGIWIANDTVVDPHRGGQSFLGPPRYVDQIQLQPDNPHWRSNYRNFAIAHELCHSLGVDHHGKGDHWVTFDPAKNPDLALGADVSIAVQQGEESGDQTCLLRYWWADFIERVKGDPRSLVPYGPAEPMGSTLCITDAGTGVNDPAHKPFPKCGKAMTGRGKCLTLLTVSDVYPEASYP